MPIDLTKYDSLRRKAESGVSPKFSSFAGLLTSEISLFNRPISNQKKQQFFNDLSSLISARIDIGTALELLAENFRRSKEKELVTTIRDLVIKGKCFSEALNTTGRFSNYEYHIIRIGEEAGQLEVILSELARFYEEKIRLKRKLISSLSYPVMVMVTAVVVIIFMLTFIVPMFEDVFTRFGKDLPPLTKAIITMSHVVSSYATGCLCTISLLIILMQILKKTEWFQKRWSLSLMHTPLVGSLIRKIHLSRFSLCMYLLLQSRTPLVEAIELVKEMVNFFPLKSALGKVQNDILHGQPFHRSISKFRIFDKRMISMIKVAEETNQLDVIFRSLKDQYNAEVEQRTTILGNLLEPVLIIFISVFVGLILVSMYLPMFKLSTSIGF